MLSVGTGNVTGPLHIYDTFFRPRLYTNDLIIDTPRVENPTNPDAKPGIMLKEILHHNALTVLVRLVLLFPPVQIILRRRIKHIEVPVPLIAHLEHARHVPAPVAVIRRAPDGAEPVVVQNLIALLTELVRAEDVVHFVDVEELLDYLGAERVSCASGREGKLITLRVRIAPYQIGHGSFVRYLPEAIDDFDLVDAVDAGT